MYLFIPVLSHFANGNPWSASAGRMRYRILPRSAEEPGTCILQAQVWEGPWSYEFSTVEETRDFPLDADGLAQLPIWLEQWRQSIEARPSRTLAENAARADAVRQSSQS